MKSLLLLLSLTLAALGQRLDFAQYIIHNNCFYPILLWSGQPAAYDTVLTVGGNTTYFWDLDTGPFFTDAHCGEPSADGVGTKAFFHLSVRITCFTQLLLMALMRSMLVDLSLLHCQRPSTLRYRNQYPSELLAARSREQSDTHAPIVWRYLCL